MEDKNVVKRFTAIVKMMAGRVVNEDGCDGDRKKHQSGVGG